MVYGLIQLSEISSAVAFILVAGIAGSFSWALKPRIMRSIKSRQAPKLESQTVRTFQTFLGGDELLRELERVEASCGRIVQSVEVSGQDVNPLIIELGSLRFTLIELSGKYTAVWPLNLDNRVRMVADELGEAGSALSDEPLHLEHVKAHLDGASQSARAFITELKNPSLVNNEKKSG